MTTDYNIGVSVNHPLFVGSYARTILPLVARTPSHLFKEEAAMKLTLSEYLLFHRELLAQYGLWEAHAEKFVAGVGLI